MSDTYRQIIRRVADEVWNKLELKTVDELYAAEFEGRVPGEPVIKGPDGYKSLVKQFRLPFPDLHVTVDRILVEGDLASMEWTCEGTQKSDLTMDGRVHAGTGARIHYSGSSTFRFKGGKIMAETIYPDSLAFRKQLGVWRDPAPLEILGKEVIEELWNRNRLDMIDKFVTAEYVLHGPQGMVYRGFDGLEKHIRTLRAAIPDVHFAIDEMVCSGDRIAMRWSFKGSHQGEFHGVKASGRPIMLFGSSISKVKDGKLTETWGYWDALDLLHQMGVGQEVKVDMLA